jgi:hypothetical protein
MAAIGYGMKTVSLQTGDISNCGDHIHAFTPTFLANQSHSKTHFDNDAVETVGLV